MQKKENPHTDAKTNPEFEEFNRQLETLRYMINLGGQVAARLTSAIQSAVALAEKYESIIAAGGTALSEVKIIKITPPQTKPKRTRLRPNTPLSAMTLTQLQNKRRNNLRADKNADVSEIDAAIAKKMKEEGLTQNLDSNADGVKHRKRLPGTGCKIPISQIHISSVLYFLLLFC